MQSLPALPAAEKLLGLPVTSTSACTVRNMLDLLELQPYAPAGGAVLAQRAKALA
jgi:maleate isomerase